MTNTFSITASDWQGVDNDPTLFSNNLVKSGGVQEALMVGSEEEIDLSQYSPVRAYPNPERWITVDDNYPYTGIFVPITPGKKYKIIANNNTSTTYGLLKTNTYGNFTPVDYATGCTRTFIPKGMTSLIEAPADAHYLYIAAYTTTDVTPSYVGLYDKRDVKEVLENLDEEPIANSKNQINSGGVYKGIAKFKDISVETDIKTDVKTYLSYEQNSSTGWYNCYNTPVKKGDIIGYSDVMGFVEGSTSALLIIFQETYDSEHPLTGTVLLRTPIPYDNQPLDGYIVIEQDGIINSRSLNYNPSVFIANGDFIKNIGECLQNYEFLESHSLHMYTQYSSVQCNFEKGKWHRVEIYVPYKEGITCTCFISKLGYPAPYNLGVIPLDGNNHTRYVYIDKTVNSVVLSFSEVSEYGYAHVKVFKSEGLETQDNLGNKITEYELLDRLSASSEGIYPVAKAYVPVGRGRLDFTLPEASGRKIKGIFLKIDDATTYKQIYGEAPYDGVKRSVLFETDVITTLIVIVQDNISSSVGDISFELYSHSDTDIAFTEDLNMYGRIGIQNIQLVKDMEYPDWDSASFIPVRKGDIVRYKGFKGVAATTVNLISFETELFANKWSYTHRLVSTNTYSAVSGTVTIPNDGYICIRTIRDTSIEQYVEILKVNNYQNVRNLTIAAHNSLERYKECADLVCTGVNDELVIQKAINILYQNGGGEIYLYNGDYNIDSFPNVTNDGNIAILFPTDVSVEIKLAGETRPYGVKEAGYVSGVHLKVTAEAYESMDSETRYIVIGAQSTGVSTIQSKLGLIMSDFYITFPSNQKITQGIDCYWINRIILERIGIYNYRNGYNGQDITFYRPPAVANSQSVGIRFPGGSSNGTAGNDYRNVSVSGFGEGFKVGGEHILMEHCASFFCTYGYTFGNYDQKNAALHPITLVACTDERSINLPLFVDNGYYQRPLLDGRQPIYMINFSIERVVSATPGGILGNRAIETHPGRFRGEISYGVQNDYTVNAQRAVDEPFWESGSGEGVKTINTSHKQSGTTAERNTYVPNYMQHYYDTDLNKELIWNGTNWVDCLGNII